MPVVSGTYADALLDAMPDATAVLDEAGKILAVNKAWRMFALDHGGDAATTGVGVDYFEVCRRSALAGCKDAEVTASALRAVLSGGSVERELQYACPSPAVGRYYVLRITPIAGPGRGALVSHVNVTRRAMAEQDLERKASQDPLTGLANRSLLHERLAAALSPRPGRDSCADVGVLFLDLDGFKPINDSFGHAAGDEVLLEVAKRLREVVRPQDTVSRLGGDEFAIVAPQISLEGLETLQRRVEAALMQPHQIHGVAVSVGASTGAHLPVPGESVAAAMHTADLKMYSAKRKRATAHQ